MRHPLSLGVIGISLWSIVAAGQPSPATLPDALKSHLTGDRFGVVTSIRGLPLGVRDGLQTLFGSFLDIAEPDAAFRPKDIALNPALPTRRLVAAACSIDHCVVYYERGGVAHTWHVAIFHWTPAATRFESGGIAPGGLRTFDEVRTAALSGAIKASTSW
jgi:hypothetical protein